MNETINILQENFSVLPQEVREVIIDPGTREKIKNVCQKYALSSEKITSIQDEVFFILFGIELLNNFRANIVEKADVSYDQAIKIAFDMNSQVFKPVMEILKEVEREANMENDEEIVPDSSQTPQISKEEKLRTEPETHPDHIIVDHEEMAKRAGPPLPSQTVMPSPQIKPPFKSIVDQKLAGIVRSSSEPSRPAHLSPDSQNPQPQNPTAAPRSVSSSDNGYKGPDPYREPIE